MKQHDTSDALVHRLAMALAARRHQEALRAIDELQPLIETEDEAAVLRQARWTILQELSVPDGKPRAPEAAEAGPLASLGSNAV